MDDLAEIEQGRPVYYDRQGRPVEAMAWARLLESGDDYRRVEFTEVGGYDVSTVWLGIDHAFGGGPPLIFETMIFTRCPGEGVIEPEGALRYVSESDARLGHADVVAALRAQLAPPEIGATS